MVRKLNRNLFKSKDVFTNVTSEEQILLINNYGKDVINKLDVKELENIIKFFGEEKDAKKRKQGFMNLNSSFKVHTRMSSNFIRPLFLIKNDDEYKEVFAQNVEQVFFLNLINQKISQFLLECLINHLR